MNRAIPILLVVVLLFSSCGGLKRLEVSEVSTVFFEYNHADNINFGTEIEAKVLAIMLDGKEIDITNNKKLSFVSQDIGRSGIGKKFTLIKRPVSFSDNYAAMTLTVSDDEETLTILDTVHLNFRGNLTINARGQSGNKGVDQQNSGTKIFFRGGRDGEHGTRGENGTSANDYVAQIWREESMVYVYVRNVADNTEWKYKMLANGEIIFDLRGGNGGRGGIGGGGGDGKDGKVVDGKSTGPGDGGHGGFGGDAGNGGNGGSIQVFIHPNAAAVEELLNIRTQGGYGGEGGKGGDGGKAGDVISGQIAGAMGQRGSSGRSGMTGNKGTSSIAIIEFDYSQFQ